MFKEENITRRSNLEKNDSLSSYLGYPSQQNPYAYEVFYNFLNQIKPSSILEIGTAMGGFTMFLRLCCNDLNLNTQILSYDICSRPEYEIYRQNNIDVRVENIFSDSYDKVNSEVINFIQQEGVTIVLCDGGYKIGEFNLLSKYIKQNDFILAHDYSSNFQYFENHINKKLWNWHEIEDSSIQESVNINNLKPYMADEFQKAVWVCKIKKTN
jgi:hypothetical protein